MSSSLAQLVKQTLFIMTELNRRESQRAVIVRMQRFVQGGTFQQTTRAVLQEQVRILKNAFDNYQVEHLAVVENVADPNDMEVQHEARDAVQQIYLQTVTALTGRIDTIVAEEQEAVEAEMENQNERNNGAENGNEERENDENQNEIQQRNADNGNGNRGNFRRPRIERDEYLLDHFKPPQFKGDYSKWCEWRSAFDSMVHRSTLNHTKKMYLLKQCLGSSAEKVLSGWQIVGENYESAYETLCSVYQNPYRIKMSHLDNLFELPRLNYESYNGLRHLIDTTNSVIRQLRATGSRVEAWEEVIVHALITRMPPRTLTAWEEKYDLVEMPTQEEVMKFLAQRARSQLKQQASNSNYNNNNNNNSSSNVNQPEAEKSNQKYTGTKPKQGKVENTKQGISCHNCGQPHPMFRCSRFQSLSVKERVSRVRELNLCANCFAPNHRAGTSSCNSGPCKRCNKGLYHNTLLCYSSIASSNALGWQQPMQTELQPTHQTHSNIYRAPGSVAQSTHQINPSTSNQNHHQSSHQSGSNFQ